MSQFIAPNELHGMNEQELRALRGRIMADLRSMGQSVFLNPHIYAPCKTSTLQSSACNSSPRRAGRSRRGCKGRLCHRWLCQLAYDRRRKANSRAAELRPVDT